jgi:F0F1-type ATP synthase membrane subunit c/vacuolar-type H+-ATPase subunit K
MEFLLSLITVFAQADAGADAGRAIALGVGGGLGAVGAGIGIGTIFGKVIESVTRQPRCATRSRRSSGSASPSPRRASSTAWSRA